MPKAKVGMRNRIPASLAATDRDPGRFLDQFVRVTERARTATETTGAIKVLLVSRGSRLLVGGVAS
jgi:hypothetical protein